MVLARAALTRLFHANAWILWFFDRWLAIMGLEGIVAKRRDRPYWSGRSPDWTKVNNPDARLRVG